jgi:NAD(P) transhydrogenase
VADYDLVVIGTGPAGEKGAVQAAYFGRRVAIVERRPILGGARIHSCALPSKNLRETALSLSGLRRRSAASVHVELDPKASLADLLCRQEPIVSAEIGRVRANLRRHAVDVVAGSARFADAHTLVVEQPGEAPRRLSAEVVLIATGSAPYRPPGIPFEDPDVHDSDEILAVGHVPRSLAVVGGGVIGCEFASMLAPLGVEVTLLERGDRLLPFADTEVSQILAQAFAHVGIHVRFGTTVAGVARGAGGIVTRLSGGGELVTEQVLCCAGRTGNTAELDLAAAGLGADERGRLAVNPHYQTKVPHIYAAGDVIGFPGLASTSMEQARLAMCHAFDLKYKTAMSPILPLGIYTIPELSMVGESEDSARAKGIAYEVGRAYYRDNPRGQLAGDPEGIVKLLFARDDQRLLGAHIVGERATELIHIASTTLQHGGKLGAFIDAVYNYPTLSELYKYAAYDALGRLGARA